MNKRAKILSALFSKAAKMGIDADVLRDDIAPQVIKKRLSEASGAEIARVLDHVTGFDNPPQSPFSKGGFNYDSSRDGLLEEMKDAARARWGEHFEGPLNAFINSHRRRAVTHYRFLRIAELKEFKNRLKNLNRTDPWNG